MIFPLSVFIGHRKNAPRLRVALGQLFIFMKCTRTIFFIMLLLLRTHFNWRRFLIDALVLAANIFKTLSNECYSYIQVRARLNLYFSESFIKRSENQQIGFDAVWLRHNSRQTFYDRQTERVLWIHMRS